MSYKMSSEDDVLNWGLYFSTLSDKCLDDIAYHLKREQMKREYRRYALSPLSAGEALMVGQGKSIDAIKCYRERMRTSLREAKFAVDIHRGLVAPAC